MEELISLVINSITTTPLGALAMTMQLAVTLIGMPSQIRAIKKEGASSQISLWFFVLCLASTTLWMMHGGLENRSAYLVISSAVGLAFTLKLVITILKYR